jgi:hypothetical protein
MSLPKLLSELDLKGRPDEGSLGPILRGLVVPCLLKDNVCCDAREESSIIVSSQLIELR